VAVRDIFRNEDAVDEAAQRPAKFEKKQAVEAAMNNENVPLATIQSKKASKSQRPKLAELEEYYKFTRNKLA
jgi:hypothetical protein